MSTDKLVVFLCRAEVHNKVVVTGGFGDCNVIVFRLSGTNLFLLCAMIVMRIALGVPMMSCLVVASTERISRIASPLNHGSRRRGRTFRNRGNDLSVAVALQSVPLRLTCWPCQRIEADAHHSAVLSTCLPRAMCVVHDFLSCEFCILLYFSRIFSYFFRNQEPKHHCTSTSCVPKGSMPKKSTEIEHHFEENGAVLWEKSFIANASFRKNSRCARII